MALPNFRTSTSTSTLRGELLCGENPPSRSPIHQAAHAVALVDMGYRFEALSLVDICGREPVDWHAQPDLPDRDVIAAAGMIAEIHENTSYEPVVRLSGIRLAVMTMHHPELLCSGENIDQALCLVDSNWSGISSLAAALLSTRWGVLSYAECLEHVL